MEKKINYQKNFNKTIESLQKSNKKPKLLLHVCCGPCFTIPYEQLKEYFDITIIYNNSNIYPEEEYHRRLTELKWYIDKKNLGIKIIEFPYDNKTYNLDLEPLADLPEGHGRCRICFRKRLKEGFTYALQNDFEYFGTVMTISRYKNAQDINRIGHELEKEFSSIKWLDADFKKNNGYEQSLLIIKETGMYFQEYCGCIYSYQKFKNKTKI